MTATPDPIDALLHSILTMQAAEHERLTVPAPRLDRIREDGLRWPFDADRSGTIMGMPFFTSEHVEPGEFLVFQAGEDGMGIPRPARIHVHPRTAHQLLLSLQRGVRMSDIDVQLDASLWWQRERIEAAGRRAEIKLDQMATQFRNRADARAEAFDHPREHFMIRDELRLMSLCMECDYEITDESAAHLGLRVIV